MVRLELKLLGERIAVEMRQPPERVRLDEVLPLLYDIDNRVIDLAVKKVEAAGKQVSCRTGCADCCRTQPVPITPPEANALRRLVESLPQARREQVEARFAANVEQLRRTGLLQIFQHEIPTTTKKQARDAAERYFRLGLVCPFLENDACSIYAARPFVCRQYLVTSPAELCADPFNNPVEPVPVPLRPAAAMLKVAEQQAGSPQFSLPLTVALDYVNNHRAELERTYSSANVFRESVEALANPGSA
jgi:Fe-S-cluster containining protein